MIEKPTYFYESQLVFSADSLHFAYFPWTTYSRISRQGGVAISFYSNGTITKQYTLNEVILDISALVQSVSHVQWEDESKRTFDASENFLTVTAKDGTTTGFLIITGEITFRAPTYLVWKIIVVVAGSALFLLVIGAIYKARKKNT